MSTRQAALQFALLALAVIASSAKSPSVWAFTGVPMVQASHGHARGIDKSRRRQSVHRLVLRAKDSQEEGEEGIFGGDFPSYNNVEDTTASDGAPSLPTPKYSKKPGEAWAGFGGSARRLAELQEGDLTEQLKERVFYVMLDAFDNYPPQEVGRMLDLLWEAGVDAGPTKTSLRQLVLLTSEVEKIAETSRIRSGIPGAY